MKNYDDKAKYKTKDRSCGEIKKDLIISPEKYKIQ